MTTIAPAPSPATGPSRPDGSAVLVLLGDDEPSLAEPLGGVLRHEGCEVRVVDVET